jgi:uncharacterized membrane-anchored protein
MKQIHLLTGTAIFHLLSLVFMVVWSALPLVFGQSIKVMVEPVDPRSLFRGNYVILSYPFSQLTEEHFIEDREFLKANVRKGTEVYVKLIEKNGLHILEKASLKPFIIKDGVTLKGGVKRFWTYEKTGFNCNIHYGIEAYFAQKEKAEEWQKSINRKITSARIKVLSSGRSGIDGLELKERDDEL